MNKTHRSIWNSALGAWVAVSEITRARGKRSGAAVALVLIGSSVWAQSATIDNGAHITVPGSQSSPWNINGVLFVGYQGQGTLSVEAGGTVSNTTGFIGYTTGSTGDAMVTGANSTWANSDNLFVGYYGTGALIVQDGGTVSSTHGYIGFNTGSNGNATVSGAGATWTNNGILSVGNNQSQGTLTVQGGGTVSNTYGYIGNGTGTTGTATVSGTNSTWAHSNNLFVGWSGNGTLTVKDDGTVSNINGYIGYNAGSTGNATVTGAGSTWTNSGQLLVGTFGQGTLTIADGGKVSVNNGIGLLTVANGASSTGVLNIGGAVGSTAQAAGTLAAGELRFGAGTGSLNFNHTDAAYTFGTQITGVGAVNQVAGTTILTGANTYSRATTISGGTLRAGALNTLSSSSAIVLANTADAQLDLNNLDQTIGSLAGGGAAGGNVTLSTATLTTGGDNSSTSYAGALSGTGASTLNKVGSGTMTLTGTSSYGVTNVDGGTLAIENGGKVSDTDGYIGSFSGSIGTATVSGANSTWAHRGELHVGDGGRATLTVQDGGKVTNTYGYIGYVSGSTGNATVSGANSTWANSGALYVGTSGQGTLSVKDGGQVNDATGFIGYNTGSTGDATVSGAGATWTHSGGLYVGSAGNGTLTVQDGGTVSNATGFIGYDTGSTGEATVNGAGSTWSNTNNLSVGNSGTGALSVKNGGTVSNFRGYIGAAASGTGEATVTGAGSTWANSNDLYVGLNGQGKLTVSNSGTVSNSDGLIGYSSGSTGEATVSGAGATWTNRGSLYVGNSGTGALTVQAGGKVSNTTGYIGYGTDSTGNATVSGAGATWTNSGSLYVGNGGKGTLTVEAGGKVGNTNGYIGGVSGSIGKATVSGAGATWTNSGELYVGRAGNGTLTVADGGKVENTNATIGSQSTSTGTATVSGMDATWTNRGELHVGDGGRGTLTVQDGGKVNNTAGYIGYVAGSTGTATVSGAGATWANSGNLFVGNSGTGTLTVKDGGTVSNINGYIGYNAGSTGNATVTGAGATWANSGQLFVGTFGQGTLTIADGGKVSVNNGTGLLTVANGASSTGLLNIGGAVGSTAQAAGTLSAGELRFRAGTGSLNFNHTDTAYTFGTRITGAGAVNQVAGTTILTGTSTYTGVTTVHGGTLRVNGSTASSAVTVNNGGTLGGSGTVGATTVASGGNLQGSSGQTLTTGALALDSGAKVNVALGTPSTTGLFQVNGALTLDGTLNVSDAGGLGVGVYRLMNYTGLLSNNGLDMGTTPAGSSFIVQTAVDKQVNLVNTAGQTLNFWDGGDSSKFNNGQIDGGNGTWSASNSSWTTQVGTINAPMAPTPGFAVFQGPAGTVTVDAAAGPLEVTGMQFASDGYTLQGDAVALTGTEAIIRVGDGSATPMTATIASQLTGTARLNKVGDGTLILAGANTYTGGTTVGAGVLQGTTTSLQGDITNNAQVVFDQGTAGTYAGAMDGSGALTKTGAGTLTLSGTNSYTGGTTVSAGVLQGSSSSLQGLITNNASVVFDQAAAGSYTGVMGGSGSLTKTGASDLTLTSANRYSGGTTVDAGALFAGVSGALGSGPVAVNTNAALVFQGSANAGNLVVHQAAGGSGTNGGFVQFKDSSSAGNAQFTVLEQATVEFKGDSTAGSARFDNLGGGNTDFTDRSTAGTAHIENGVGGQANFLDDASAGQATLVNHKGGLVDFFDRSTADGATVVNNAGGNVRIKYITTNGISIGSLEGAGNVLLDTKNLTTGGLGTSTTISGVISGVGGSLTKTGAGTLTLSGTNTYSGATTVQGGTLLVNGSTANSAVTVATGGALGGSGKVGATTVATGGTLLGSSGQTLTTGALVLDSGAHVNVTLGTAGNPALFQVNGALTLDGTLNVSDAGGFGAGVYRLMDYSGTLTDQGLEIGTAPTGAALSVQTAVNHQVNLVNTAGQTLNFWDGGDSSKFNNGQIDGGNGTWSASNSNWATQDGTINAPMAPTPGFAVFQGPAGTVTVDAAAGALAATGMQFASDGYVLQGDAITLSGPQGTRPIIRVGDGSGAHYTATITSALNGNAGLEKTDVGTLILTGANTYTGGTTVSGGVLQGSTTSLQGDIHNNALVRFDQGAAGTYAGAMDGSGALEKTGAGTLTLASANRYSGGTTIKAGTLVGSAASFGSGAVVNQGALELAQATDGSWANGLSGSGAVTKTGAGALRYTGDGSAFTGTTQVNAGSLAVNGKLGGSLSVGSGARLQGSGTVGSTHLLAGAVLAPGNSIGTLKVAGDLAFDAGARYEVEAQPDGQSDQVQVSGKATLGGASTVVLAANGSWNPLTRYTILTAGGGLVGTFGTVSSSFAFLTPSLDYSAQEVALTLKRNDVDFADVGGSANQRATGAGAQTVGAGSLYNALVQLDAPTARSAFDQLSGEIHASLRTALVEDSRLVREAATDRLRLAQGGVAVNATQVAQAADGGAGWARAYGAWGESDSDGNAAQMDRSVRGVLIGGDQRFGDWRLGAFAGGGRSKVELDARSSSALVDSVHLGLYGGTQWGALGLRTGLAYSRHTIDTTRHVAFTGLAESALAGYQAQTTQVFGELGWQLGAGVTALEPFVNLAYVDLKTDGFQERGGISALSASSQRTGTGMATLGVRASTQWTVGSTPVTARGVLGWRHALGDVASSTSVAFAGGGLFAVAGVPVAKNVAVLELGLDMALQRDLTLGVAYSGQLGRDFREHGVKANLLWKF